MTDKILALDDNGLIHSNLVRAEYPKMKSELFGFPYRRIENNILYVCGTYDKGTITPIKGVTVIEEEDISYHTPREGWIPKTRSLYTLVDGAEFIYRDKHYLYKDFSSRPIWVHIGYINGLKPIKYSMKRRFESTYELLKWREARDGKFSCILIRFL